MTDIQSLNPYRGPFAFTSNDEKCFFGREKETEELIKLIRNCQLTILFGTSGTGKTSLIQAKLLPQLEREYFHPIYLRINFDSADPLEYTRKRIVEELRKWQADLPDFEDNQSILNFAAKTVIFKGLVKPILFFDQFEELFTLGPKNDPDKIHKFINELSDLIELRLSDDLKNSENIYNLSNFKVVFSLRQDWVAYLEDYSHIIPSVLENRYRLKKFSSRQAFEAIYLPAMDKIDQETVKNIILEIGERALTEEILDDKRFVNKALKNLVIDPFLLSLYCFQLYEKCIESREVKISNELVNANSHKKLIRNYYDQKTFGLINLKKLIENDLLDESGKRLTLSLDKFTSGDTNLSKQFTELAVNTGVIRIIGENTAYEVEIIHDQLANQIFQSRVERKAKEINEEAERKEAEATRLRTSAKRAKKTTILVIVTALAILCMVIFSTLLWRKKLILEANSDFTVGGLQTQLSTEILVNRKLEDSTQALKQIISNLISGLSNKNSTISLTGGQAFKLQDNLIRQQKISIDSLKNENNSLTISSNDKDQKIQRLHSGQLLANETIKKLETSLNENLITKSESSTENGHRFEKEDFTNLKILNATHSDGSYDFNDIKKKGFIFSFIIAPVSKDEKGKIEIRVYYKVSRTTSSYELDFKSIEELRTQKQPITYNMPVPDLKPGAASYEVKYFIDRNSPNTAFIVDRGDFTISRPLTQPVQ